MAPIVDLLTYYDTMAIKKLCCRDSVTYELELFYSNLYNVCKLSQIIQKFPGLRTNRLVSWASSNFFWGHKTGREIK